MNIFNRIFKKKASKHLDVINDISLKVKRLIRIFLEGNDIIINTLGISLIEVTKEEPNTIYIEILLNRPGLLIGKGGERIDKLRDFMEKKLGKSVEINLKEYDAFY